MQLPTLENASLNWDEHGHPISATHDDLYYSRENGIEESNYVFLQHNAIKERLTGSDTSIHLTVAEIGFGTGLNFLCTWYAWKQLNQISPTKSLHFVSVEKWPIHLEDFRKVIAHWPDMAELCDQLVSQYPAPTKGCHRLVFEGGKVTLTLYFGDVEEQYESALFMADAWYLDGFAPHKSPDMWSSTLFDIIGAHSAPNATFSTFSIAGVIRRGMTSAGFTVQKVPGFGRKKEMHAGALLTKPQHLGITSSLIKSPWLRTPIPNEPHRSGDFDVIVIGAGLAGCTTAHSLAIKNKRVLVLDKAHEPGTGGSGNPQGALYNKFSTELNIQTEYALANLLFSQCYYDRVQQSCDTKFWSKCGLIQVAWNDKEVRKQSDLFANNHYPNSLLRPLTKAEATELSGITLNHSGIYFPESGWVAPKILCRHTLKHPNITARFNQCVNEIKFDTESRLWLCYDAGHELIATANNIAVCSATEANKLNQLEHLRTKAIRGQVSIAKLKQALPIKTVICGEGYISPATNGYYCFGATFDLQNQQCEVIDEDNVTNITQLTNWLTTAKNTFNNDNTLSMEGRASLRCTSPDYLPMVGHAPIYEAQIERFSQLRFDAKTPFEGEGAYHSGLFVNIAHGSKGLSSCPLAAEYITSLICDEPSPLSQDMIKAISPSRFIIRNLIRRKI